MNIISRIMGVDKTPEDKYKYIWFTMGTACFALAACYDNCYKPFLR